MLPRKYLATQCKPLPVWATVWVQIYGKWLTNEIDRSVLIFTNQDRQWMNDMCDDTSMWSRGVPRPGKGEEVTQGYLQPSFNSLNQGGAGMPTLTCPWVQCALALGAVGRSYGHRRMKAQSVLDVPTVVSTVGNTQGINFRRTRTNKFHRFVLWAAGIQNLKFKIAYVQGTIT